MISETSPARQYREDPDAPGYWFYGEYRIQAVVDTHLFAVEWAADNLPRGSRVLDVAGGQGALAQQLVDRGFHVSCTSWDGRVQADVPVYTLNLDESFGPADVGGRYPLVCAVEIIEHLENPAHFLRQLSGLLEEGGHLVLTTPNVESATARLQWLARGEPLIFSRDEVRKNRHISMLWRSQLEYLIELAGMELVMSTTVGGSRPRRTGLLRHLAKGALLWLIRRFGRGEPEGEIRVMVLRAADEARRAGPEEFY